MEKTIFGNEVIIYARDRTLRDYFAAKAMVAIIVESWEVDDEACQTAYKWADAMLKAREAK